LAQYPYLISPDVTLGMAAAPMETLEFIAYAVPAGLVLLFPSLWLLFQVREAGPRERDPVIAEIPPMN
jgi:cytochrome d ubiquinol oxidase subunit II